MAIYLDAGTTYTKAIVVNESVLDLLPHLHHEQNGRKYYIFPSKSLKNMNLNVTKACGHMGGACENEIVAMSLGAKDIVEANSTILDLGSRDAKWIRFKDKKFAAGCSRDVIIKGAEQLGWDLDTLLEKTILAMREDEAKINEYMEKEYNR